MTRLAYWVIAVAALVFAGMGVVVLRPPQPENVEIRLLEEFYRSQYFVSSMIGLVIGLAGAWLSTHKIRHRQSDRGADFNSRVMFWGLASAVLASVAAGITASVAASLGPFEPLAPTEKMMLIVGSGLFVVLLALAFVFALIAFAAYSRVPEWGGRYAVFGMYKRART